MQVMTVVEGLIPGDAQAKFVRDYRELLDAGLLPSIAETFLLREAGSGMLWRIATIWQSRQDLDEMRRANEVPPSVRLFQEAGVDPLVRVFEVVAAASA
jgi:hypothetical protein